ncbi:hypothetical protein KDX05_06975 [Burkholderia vietnamiensis]|uniref:hypothetical protein n=1 Tax=Burkholderia vietnamiensis TaxID=60552 RepID=UPI001B9C9715|nr:hypothetical protein [Burkholderia vietnamiensis]MBR8228053.1 hypothetical protein [Burkholderia vietnamiensis]
MSEPILSREEVKTLYSKHFANPYDLLPLWAEAFAAALESALLEKLCGEPIYQTCWKYPESVWGDVEKDVYDNYQTYRYACRRIVYALNRSKA